MELKPEIVLLDAETLGKVEALKEIENLGNLTIYQTTKNDLVAERIKNATIIITNKVLITKEVMLASPKLKLICVAATGMNNIDLVAAKELGIEVRNVSGYSTNSVAQQTFASLLHLQNHIQYYNQFVQNGEYVKSEIFTNLAYPIEELSGKTFGIIGLGTIGKKVAQIAESFGLKVIYYSASGNKYDVEYEAVSLAYLLQNSDLVSIHAPLRDDTKNLITAKELVLMKSSAKLINTGRGGIVNHSDLAYAIDNDIIAGACIDVYAVEPIPFDEPLLNVKKKQKLVLTPHVAWASVQARETLVKGIINHIKLFINK